MATDTTGLSGTAPTPGTTGQTGHPEPASDFLVVGLGASAGGILALQTFFENVPAESGAAYVVILHLSPDHDSQLAQVLQRTTSLPVTQVIEQVKIEPNHVYVVPPNQHLTMQDGEILVSPNLKIEDRRAPVDIFFRTLAESHQRLAVGVILSGTGAHGSMGLKRIKEQGGAVFVQNPREAEFNEMPRSAVATGLVDDILPVMEMPGRIMAYRQGQLQNQFTDTQELPEEKAQAELANADVQASEAQQQSLRKIFSLLRTQTGHDFSNYKLPTLLRRIERRLNVHNIRSIASYADLLQHNSNEVHLLLKDLLISVTNFFRDKDTFAFLETEIIPRILQGKTASDQVRIWVAGCATGEEAYSLAMLFAEQVLDGFNKPKVQIFATDIDELAIAHAREGFYTLNDVADVSPERLRAFFTEENGGFRIRREIREMILFTNHNIIKDAPFSHLDLVSCRNLLIYFNRAAQERTLETIHFALNPGSYLLLGGSELPDVTSDLYAVVNREHHLFQSRPTSGRIYPVPESIPAFRYEQASLASVPERAGREQARVTFGDLHLQLLEQYAPPSVVVNENHEIVHMSEHAGRYLQMGGGEVTSNLLSLIRPELRLELRTALYQAAQQQTSIEVRGLTIHIEGKAETVNLRLRPVMGADNPMRGYILVLFEPAENPPEPVQPVLKTDEPLARQLEIELMRLKTQLRLSNEQHEVQAEELRASNEELQAVNEELRSAAEELETSKEELQSINEELRTVNQELKVKIDEITLVNNNLQNLTNSVDIGIIFLDRAFRVNLFTPAARAIYNLIPQDMNRPLSDITHRLTDTQVIQDAELVLQTLQPIQREVKTVDGHIYMMRLRPYRTSQDQIQGVVITFVDIHELKETENALRDSEDWMRLLIESATEYAIFALDPDGNITMWSVGAERIFGWKSDEVLTQSAEIIYTPEDRVTNTLNRELALAQQTGNAPDERVHLRKGGARFYASGFMSALKRDGLLRGYVKIARDLTVQRTAALQLQEAHDSLERHVQERTAALNATNGVRRELLRRLVNAQEEERARIARELHDQTGQVLTAAIFSLSTLEQIELPTKAQPILADLTSKLQNLMEEIHALVQGIRSPVLDTLGLEAALQDYAQQWSKSSNIPASAQYLSTNGARLPPEVEITIYRLVQEALTNVMRHAQNATQVDISVIHKPENLTAIIEDNGPGFDLTASMADKNQRLGLIGMQERAALIGGMLTIDSAPGQGTIVTLTVPLSPNALNTLPAAPAGPPAGPQNKPAQPA